jgi:hypothetical protein
VVDIIASDACAPMLGEQKGARKESGQILGILPRARREVRVVRCEEETGYEEIG